MNPQQVEALQTIITLASGAATAAAALAQTISTLLKVADQLRRRRRRARRRGPRRGRGRAPRRRPAPGPLGVAARRPTRPPGRGPPRPGHGRPGRARRPKAKKAGDDKVTLCCPYPLAKLAAACVPLGQRSTGGQPQGLHPLPPSTRPKILGFLRFSGFIRFLGHARRANRPGGRVAVYSLATIVCRPTTG